MADIFFSYKREDRAGIEPLVHLLERDGFTVWWDLDLVAGERFDDVIRHEIEQARCVMVAWSVHSTRAMWVRDEAASGRERGILVPLSLDGAPPPLGFGGYQTPDLSTWREDPDDPRIRQLLDGVRRVVRGESTLPVPPDRVVVAPRPAIPRRRLLQAGGVGAAVLATGGAWGAYALLGRRATPPLRTEEFDLVTVDEHGAVQPPQRQSVTVFDVPVGPTTLAFSVIPAGGFAVGSPDAEPERRPNEGPQQDVEFTGFALGRTAVTQAQWAALVEAVPDPIGQTLPAHPSFFLGDDLPVETVSWDFATEFCRRLAALTGLGIRLPSETEWEYACRARTVSPFHFGPTLTSDVANYLGSGGAVGGENEGADVSSPTYDDATYASGAYGNGPVGVFIGRTKKVRSYPPNRFGLFEMHGNVWEHCADSGPADYRQVPKDGAPYRAADESYHVLRGGSWSHNPAICRSAYRDAIASSFVGWQGRVGLRVACDLGPSGPRG